MFKIEQLFKNVYYSDMQKICQRKLFIFQCTLDKLKMFANMELSIGGNKMENEIIKGKEYDGHCGSCREDVRVFHHELRAQYQCLKCGGYECWLIKL